MVKQGDIIKVNFTPQSSHEQAGYRPAVVVSNHIFNQKSSVIIICPITNTISDFPLHVALDEHTKTTGMVLCNHIKALDLNSRGYKFVERMPAELLKKIVNMVIAQVSL